LVFIIITIRCKALVNRKKVVGRNPLRIVKAESEANIVEGAFKTVNARLLLHPQTAFRAFPVHVITAREDTKSGIEKRFVRGERGEKWSVHKDEVVDMPRALTILEVNETNSRFRNARSFLIAMENGRAQLDLNVLPFSRPFPSCFLNTTIPMFASCQK
jgi:hypothetical protein